MNFKEIEYASFRSWPALEGFYQATHYITFYQATHYITQNLSPKYKVDFLYENRL